jgi:hypothetical protein
LAAFLSVTSLLRQPAQIQVGTYRKCDFSGIGRKHHGSQFDLLIPSKYEMLFREPIVFSPDRLKTAWGISEDRDE